MCLLFVSKFVFGAPASCTASAHADANAAWLAAGIFSVEIVLRFFTGIVIVNRMRQALIMDRRIVALHCLLHGPFLLDLAVVATLWAEVWRFVCSF